MEATDSPDRSYSPHLLRHNDAADHGVNCQQCHPTWLPGNNSLPVVEQAEGDGGQGGDLSLQRADPQQGWKRFDLIYFYCKLLFF